MKIVKLSPESIQEITGSLLKRSPSQYTEYEDTVNDILKNIRENRDKALFVFFSKFDGFTLTPDNIRVTKSEIEEAYTKLDPEYIEVIRKAATNISDFHKKQLDVQTKVMMGEELTQEMQQSVQDLYQIVAADPLAAEYLQCEMRFQVMMQDVFNILGDLVKF